MGRPSRINWLGPAATYFGENTRAMACARPVYAEAAGTAWGTWFEKNAFALINFLRVHYLQSSKLRFLRLRKSISGWMQEQELLSLLKNLLEFLNNVHQPLPCAAPGQRGVCFDMELSTLACTHSLESFTHICVHNLLLRCNIRLGHFLCYGDVGRLYFLLSNSSNPFFWVRITRRSTYVRKAFDQLPSHEHPTESYPWFKARWKREFFRHKYHT